MRYSTPHTSLARLRAQVGRRRLAERSAVEVEAQAIPRCSADAPLERLHAAPAAERLVVHVGAIGEVPDLVGRPAGERQTAQQVVTGRKPPRHREPSTPLHHRSSSFAGDCGRRAMIPSCSSSASEQRQQGRRRDQRVEVAAVRGPPVAGRNLHRGAELGDRRAVAGAAPSSANTVANHGSAAAPAPANEPSASRGMAGVERQRAEQRVPGGRDAEREQAAAEAAAQPAGARNRRRRADGERAAGQPPDERGHDGRAVDRPPPRPGAACRPP